MVNDDDNPYADTFAAYHAAGWIGVIPLPHNQKGPPPSGFTGRAGAYPDYLQMQSWADEGRSSIGLRLAPGEFGIDVDCYDGKPGAATMAELAAECGPLPPTVMSTSRHDGSGIRLYRVPEGWESIGGLPGVEFIQPHHRYAAVWPSINPLTCAMYQWNDERTGEVLDGPPDATDLAVLPVEWLARLAATSGSVDKVALTSAQARALLDLMPDGEPCRDVLHAAQLHGAGTARHDDYLRAVAAVCWAGRSGCPGASGVLARLHRDFIADVTTGKGSRTVSVAEAEWTRNITGALGIVSTAEQGHECEAAAGDEFMAEIEADHVARKPGELPREFWSAHPQLRLVKSAADARRMPPGAVLISTLAIVNARIPAGYVLPPTLADVGSLNLMGALLGPPGTGKSGCIGIGRSLTGTVGEVWDEFLYELGSPATEFGLREGRLGSGEGIVALFCEHITETYTGKDGKPKTRTVYVRVRDAVLIADPEGSGIGPQLERTGSTLLQVLLALYSGEDPTSSYSNRTTKPPPPLAGRTYRAAMVLGIQPDNVGLFLRHAGSGLPQRLVWATTTAPRSLTVGPFPEFTRWTPPPMVSRDAMHQIDVPYAVSREVSDMYDAYLARLDDGDDSLDGHRGFTTLKVAASLHAWLHPGLAPAVTDETWALAKVILTASDEVRLGAQSHVGGMLDAEDVRRARREVKRTLMVDDAKEERATLRRGRNLWAVVHRHAEEVGPNHSCARSACLGHGIASRDRGTLDDDIEYALSRGWLVELHGDDGPRYTLGGSEPAAVTR